MNNAISHQLIFLFGLFSSALVLLFGVGNDYDNKTALCTALVGVSAFISCSAVSVRFDIRHPFVWFNGIFWLYTISFPILFLLDYRFSSYTKCISSITYSVILEYIAVVTFSIAVRPKVVHYGKMSTRYLRTIFIGSVPFIWATFFGSLFFLYNFFRLGINLKTDKYFVASSGTNMSFVFTFLSVGMCFYISRVIYDRKSSLYKSMTVFFVYFFVAYLVCGERGILFRFLMVVVLLYTTLYREIKPLKFFILAMLGILLSTIMGFFKNVLVSMDFSTSFEQLKMFDIVGAKGIVLLLLGSEFRGVGDNLSLIAEYVPESMPFLDGQSLWWELRSLLKFGFLSDRESAMDTASWFAKTFFPAGWEAGKGWGFTLVGQGYLDFGVFGVIVLFAILGFFIGLLYRMSSKNIVYFIFYINSIPTILYALRQTIAPILSQPLKHVILPIFIMFFLGKIMRVISGIRMDPKKACSLKNNPSIEVVP